MSEEQLPAKLIQEADRLLEDALWAEKQHFAMATIWRRLHLWLGIPSALMAGAAGVSAIQSYPNLAAGLAASSAIVTTLLTFLSPEEMGRRHYDAAVGYSTVRGRLRRYRNIEAESPEFQNNGSTRINELAEEKKSLMDSAPHIGGLSYRLAKRSIENGDHLNKVNV
jgi:hypothetical protein